MTTVFEIDDDDDVCSHVGFGYWSAIANVSAATEIAKTSDGLVALVASEISNAMIVSRVHALAVSDFVGCCGESDHAGSDF